MARLVAVMPHAFHWLRYFVERPVLLHLPFHAAVVALHIREPKSALRRQLSYLGCRSAARYPVATCLSHLGAGTLQMTAVVAPAQDAVLVHIIYERVCYHVCDEIFVPPPPHSTPPLRLLLLRDLQHDLPEPRLRFHCRIVH